jgi:DNA processing protein
VSDSKALSAQERFDWLRLSRCDNVGPRTFSTLLKRHGSAAKALEALPALAAKSTGKRVLRLAEVKDVEAEFEAAERCGARFIGWDEPDYPWLLRQIDSAPPIIAIRGNLPVFSRATVAIIGSRNASAAGLAFTEQLSRGLAEAGFVVVSGLARGIDARAHRATSETGTVAVLAGGHDKIYPAEHEKLLEQLLEHGAAVSEMPFGWTARDRDFPRRNRIVSGLSLGVIVVEAAKNSGSLITANFALDQGREVFAVPGSPLDPRSQGTNELLRNGVQICTRVEDVVDALARLRNGFRHTDLFSEAPHENGGPLPFWDELDLDDEENGSSKPKTDMRATWQAVSWQPEVKPPVEGHVPEATGDLPSGPERVIGFLGPSPVSIDELVRATEMSAREIRAVLLELELAGRLERHGANLVSLLSA